MVLRPSTGELTWLPDKSCCSWIRQGSQRGSQDLALLLHANSFILQEHFVPEEAKFWEVGSYPVIEVFNNLRVTCACDQPEPLEKTSLG